MSPPSKTMKDTVCVHFSHTIAPTFTLGVVVGERKYGIDRSTTGMYEAIITIGFDENGEPDESTGYKEFGNYCSECLFVNDDPHNYGDIIRPTEYDGDCDECGRTTMCMLRSEEE